MQEYPFSLPLHNIKSAVVVLSAAVDVALDTHAMDGHALC
jgi:hypothetical protein